MNSSQDTIYYFGPINTSSMCNVLGPKLLIGAASRKVLSVLNAINRSIPVGLVTTPISQSNKQRYYQSAKLFENDIPVYQQASVSSAGLNRVIASINYLIFALFHTKKNDVILLYNFYIEYVPLALLFRLLGRSLFLDIEDYPTDKKCFREVLGKYSFKILRKLCNPNIIAASGGIISLANAHDGCIIHGTIKESERAYIPRPQYSGELKIQYGGTVNTETGLDLFVEMVNELRKKNESPISFVVTGFGALEAIEKLSFQNEFSQVKVILHTNLSPQEYTHLLQSCHASLSLRIPGSEISNTTFPSKVVEICANSLVLISTKISDVESVYTDAAILLDEATPECLANNILALAQHPEQIEELSLKGHTRTLETYAPEIVGAKMIAFFKKYQKGFMNG